MQNITGSSVDGNNFLTSRLYLVDNVRKLIKNHSIIIAAPRRFGKTSVIKEFDRQETVKTDENREFEILFFDLEGQTSIHDFCLTLFLRLLDLYIIRKKINQIKKIFSTISNSIVSKFKKLDISIIKLEMSEKTKSLTFSEWKQEIQPLILGLNSFKKRTVIVFDEFPDMILNFQKNASDHGVFIKEMDALTAWLRSIRQNQDQNSKYQFIFCGSVNVKRTLDKLGLEKRINDLEHLTVPPLKTEEAELLLELLTLEYDLELKQEALRFMVGKIDNGSPYYGHILFQALKDTGKKQFDLNKLKTQYENMLKGSNHSLNHFHSRLNEYLSPLDREYSEIVLKQLCQNQMDEKNLYDILLYDKIDYEAYQSIVNRLIDEGYIMRSGDNTKLTFVSTLLKDWWAFKKGFK